MLIPDRLRRFNPLRALRAIRAVPRLEIAETRLRQDQKAMAGQLKALKRMVEDLQQTMKQTAQQQQGLLERLPAVQSDLQKCEWKIDQCVRLYTTDVTTAESLPGLRRRLNEEYVARHAAAAVHRAPLETDPGAHIVVDDLLPDDVADELVNAIPPSLFFPRENMKRQEIGVPFFFAPEYSRVVWSFFSRVVEGAILPAVVEKFRPALDDFMRTHWPALGSFAESGVSLGVANSRIMLRRPGYRISPHRDPRWAFLTCLVYLQKRDDPLTYGTQFYRLRQEREPAHHSPFWIEEDEVVQVKDVPARRNTAVVFLNSTGAHGAFIPPDAPPDTERFLYQVQFGPDEATKRMLIADLEGAAQTAWSTPRGGY